MKFPKEKKESSFHHLFEPLTNNNEINKDVKATERESDTSTSPRYSSRYPSVGQKQIEENLWYWNLVCSIAHFFQGIVVLTLGVSNLEIAKFKLPLSTLFLKFVDGLPEQELKVVGYLPFTVVTSGFAFMSAIAHFAVLISFGKYIDDLRVGINQYRWIEYAFSSSLMIGLIAMLFGIYDVISLVLLMSVNACMNLFGYAMEVKNLGRSDNNIDWSNFIWGSFGGIVTWACIFVYIGASSSVEKIPDFVWGILAAYFVMFNTFPINMILQYSQIGYWSDEYRGFHKGGYYFGEKVYQILSLSAKTLLIWMVVAGTNEPHPEYNYNNNHH